MVKWSRDRRCHVTLKGQGRAPIDLEVNISKMAGDSDLVIMELLEEMCTRKIECSRDR